MPFVIYICAMPVLVILLILLEPDAAAALFQATPGRIAITGCARDRRFVVTRPERRKISARGFSRAPVSPRRAAPDTRRHPEAFGRHVDIKRIRDIARSHDIYCRSLYPLSAD